MSKVCVYDPALCCSSGVCGPSVDPVLVEFSNTLNHIKKHEVEIARFNLSQNPSAFVENIAVKNMIDADGSDSLPYVFVDDKLVFKGEYPDAATLCNHLNIPSPMAPDATSNSACCSGGC